MAADGITQDDVLIAAARAMMVSSTQLLSTCQEKVMDGSSAIQVSFNVRNSIVDCIPVVHSLQGKGSS